MLGQSPPRPFVQGKGLTTACPAPSLQVRPTTLASAARAPLETAAAHALLSAFSLAQRAQRLLLEAPPGQVHLKLVAAKEQLAPAAGGHAAAAAEGTAGHDAPALPALLPLDARSLSKVAGDGDGAQVSVALLDGCAAGGAADATEHFAGLLMEKTLARTGPP